MLLAELGRTLGLAHCILDRFCCCLKKNGQPWESGLAGPSVDSAEPWRLVKSCTVIHEPSWLTEGKTCIDLSPRRAAAGPEGQAIQAWVHKAAASRLKPLLWSCSYSHLSLLYPLQAPRKHFLSGGNWEAQPQGHQTLALMSLGQRSSRFVWEQVVGLHPRNGMTSDSSPLRWHLVLPRANPIGHLCSGRGRRIRALQSRLFPKPIFAVKFFPRFSPGM